MKKVWIALTAVLVTFVTVQFVLPPSGWAVDRAEAEETARLLAKLLEAGRLVIEQNQLLIDNPHKGDKGLTPEVFEQQLVQEFRQQTGVDLSKLQSTPGSIEVPPMAKELLFDLGRQGGRPRCPGCDQSTGDWVQELYSGHLWQPGRRTFFQTIACQTEANYLATTQSQE
jgi:hypothetical protein